MKLFQAALSLLSLAPFKADADNTPNLCTADIPNLEKIRPSQTASHPIPDITVGSATYDGDAEHFVVRPKLKKNRKYKHILVYIPGTTDRPELSSCLIKSAAMSREVPILALSYQYLRRGDKFRNQACALLDAEEQVKCLEEQHKDAIDGGDYGATHFRTDGSEFWGEVLPENSLKSRLGDLLAYLHRQYPDEGWYKFLEGGKSKFTSSSSDSSSDVPNVPEWDNIVVSGHSQGAGHAAYLAKTEKVKGAIMISGPQDECLGCDEGTELWIDEGPYESTRFFAALGHGNEPLYPVMSDNWARMKAAEGSINWETADARDVEYALDTKPWQACKSPLRTDVKYAPTSTCGGKDHCSTAIDDTVPFIEMTDGTKLYLYEHAVWPAMIKPAFREKPCS